MSDHEEHQSVKNWLGQVAGLLHENYFAGDIDGVLNKLDHFKSRLADNPPDPEQGLTETSACRGLLKLAEHFCDQLCFEECFAVCESVKGVLEAKKARYIQSGLEPTPDGIAWMTLISNLAECKWKSPVDCQDEVMGLDQMIQRYMALELSVRPKLLNLYTTDRRRAEVILMCLGWCGTFLLSSIVRYEPSKYNELKGFVNYFNEGLLDDVSKPHFWHLLIVHEYHSAEPCIATINEFYAELHNAVESYLGLEFNYHAFNVASSIEQRYITKELVKVPPLIQTDPVAEMSLLRG